MHGGCPPKTTHNIAPLRGSSFIVSLLYLAKQQHNVRAHEMRNGGNHQTSGSQGIWNMYCGSATVALCFPSPTSAVSVLSLIRGFDLLGGSSTRGRMEVTHVTTRVAAHVPITPPCLLHVYNKPCIGLIGENHSSPRMGDRTLVCCGWDVLALHSANGKERYAHT